MFSFSFHFQIPIANNFTRMHTPNFLLVVRMCHKKFHCALSTKKTFSTAIIISPPSNSLFFNVCFLTTTNKHQSNYKYHHQYRNKYELHQIVEINDIVTDLIVIYRTDLYTLLFNQISRNAQLHRCVLETIGIILVTSVSSFIGQFV